jgi:hypothetical protein
MMVAGEAGIGKTQMLREFAATARGRGAVTLWGLRVGVSSRGR